jgi:hypothetical protein
MPRAPEKPTRRRVAKKSPRKPPAALAKNALAVAERARKQNVVRARELVALVQEKIRVAAASFYEIGVALNELSQKPLFTALGYRSFEAMVRTELGFSIDKARELMDVAKGLKRTTALSLGATRAAAVIELTKATPADDTPEQVARGEVVVPGHHAPVRPKDMSAHAIERAASTVRKAHRPRKGRDDDAEAWLAKLVAKLRKRDPHATGRLVKRQRKGETATTAVAIGASLEALRKLLGD